MFNFESVIMKLLNITFLFIYLFSISCNSKTKEEVLHEILDSSPVVSLEEEIFDFGDIYEGEIVQHKFKITNIGEGYLIIASANASCGCTVAKWSKDPISSGQDGFVDIIFDSKNRKGNQKKTITLLTNATPNVTVLTIKGNIIN